MNGPSGLGWRGLPTGRRRAVVLAGLAALALAVVGPPVAERWLGRRPAGDADGPAGLAAYVSARAVPGDVLAVGDPALEVALRPLVRGLELRTLPPVGPEGRPVDRPPRELLEPLLAGRRRLWFVNPGAALGTWLGERALTVDEARFAAPAGALRLLAYERPPLDLADLPPRGGADAVLGKLKPLGAETLPNPLAPGRVGRVRLAWQVYRDGAPDYRIGLWLRDAGGRTFGHSEDRVPSAKWPPGEVVYWPLDLPVSADAPPGAYRLAITVTDPSTGESWPPESPLILAEVQVGRAGALTAPGDPPRRARRGAERPGRPGVGSLAGDGAQRLGYDVAMTRPRSAPGTVAP
jgi:hypothetical protein